MVPLNLRAVQAKHAQRLNAVVASGAAYSRPWVPLIHPKHNLSSVLACPIQRREGTLQQVVLPLRCGGRVMTGNAGSAWRTSRPRCAGRSSSSSSSLCTPDSAGRARVRQLGTPWGMGPLQEHRPQLHTTQLGLSLYWRRHGSATAPARRQHHDTAVNRGRMLVAAIVACVQTSAWQSTKQLSGSLQSLQQSGPLHGDV